MFCLTCCLPCISCQNSNWTIHFVNWLILPLPLILSVFFCAMCWTHEIHVTFKTRGRAEITWVSDLCFWRISGCLYLDLQQLIISHIKHLIKALVNLCFRVLHGCEIFDSGKTLAWGQQLTKALSSIQPGASTFNIKSHMVSSTLTVLQSFFSWKLVPISSVCVMKLSVCFMISVLLPLFALIWMLYPT